MISRFVTDQYIKRRIQSRWPGSDWKIDVPFNRNRGWALCLIERQWVHSLDPINKLSHQREPYAQHTYYVNHCPINTNRVLCALYISEASSNQQVDSPTMADRLLIFSKPSGQFKILVMVDSSQSLSLGNPKLARRADKIINLLLNRRSIERPCMPL